MIDRSPTPVPASQPGVPVKLKTAKPGRTIQVTWSILFLVSMIFSGCSQAPSEAELQMTQEAVQAESLRKTAAFETEVVAFLTEWAPTVTITPSPTSTPTLTPEPSLTPTITETVFKDPWIFQDECISDPGLCVQFSIENTNKNNWVNATLIFTETGEKGEFSVPPKSTRSITLIPGEYKAIYYSFCSDAAGSVTRVEVLGNWTIYFTCGLRDGFSYAGRK